MVNSLQNEYCPDSASAPGETLEETLDALGMSQTELAKRMGRPVKTINEIIQGKAAITPETALQLEQVLRVPASFWLRLEQHYRETLARLAEGQRLIFWTEWLKVFPVREMIHRDWLPSCNSKTQQVFEVLKFFGVASPDAWKEIWEHQAIKYRKSTIATSNFGTVTAWLRQGEIQAQAVETQPYNADAFRNALDYVRSLTVKPVSFFQNELVRSCAEAGVAVVFVPELPGTGICGATRWLTPTKALVQLSLRYKTDDQLWFTFFHEAGHILLHGKRQVFLDLADHESDEEPEAQANTFAADILVNPVEWRQFVTHGSYHTKAVIQAFAQKVGIAPGIIVGRLQHEQLLSFAHCNDLKCRLEWKQDSDTCSQ